MDLPPSLAMPCPLSAGWEVVEQRLVEPSQGGGFSAGAYRPDGDELWLLSDAPRGSISRWRGLAAGGLKALQAMPPLPLNQPEPMDGEGLVLGARQIWVAAEGRRQPAQPAALLRYDLGTGSLQSSRALPPDWQLQSGRGLADNGGPESLTPIPSSHDLLMAAEQPLQQDPDDRVRLLRWAPDASGTLQPVNCAPWPCRRAAGGSRICWPAGRGCWAFGAASPHQTNGRRAWCSTQPAPWAAQHPGPPPTGQWRP